MLPFLKNKTEGSVSMPADKVERKPDNPEDLDLLEGCVREFIDAIKADDAKAASQALKSAFEICDASPHEEGENY
jgi:hypothetical protein